MIIEFTLYGTPITKKNHQQIFTNKATGKPFITQSSKYKQYEQDCILQIPRQAKQKIDQPCKVTTIFYMPDKRRVDVSNLVSAAHDILVAGDVLKDDSSAIVKIIVAWATVDKENPRTEILIETTARQGLDTATGKDTTAPNWYLRKSQDALLKHMDMKIAKRDME